MQLSPRDVERFWSKVDKAGPVMPGMGSPCWVWTGGKDRDGYGKFGFTSMPGKTEHVRSHRVGLVLSGGVLSAETPCALHRCDNPSCVRAEHLWAGSVLENNADKTTKGRKRGARGSAYDKAKLTEVDVQAIRTIRARGFGTLEEIGEMFGVTKQTVCDIVKRRSWGYLT